MTKNWLPLESNPELLTDYATKLGMSAGYSFEDVLSLEDWALEMVPQPVVAAVFLFPLLPSEQAAAPLTDAAQPEGVLFVRQTIGNACGTIAVLHALANSEAFEADSFVGRFFATASAATPLERAALLEESHELEDKHKQAEVGGVSAVAEEVDTHFVAFIERGGRLWQLDGRKLAPVDHGPIEEGGFLSTVVTAVRSEFVSARPDELRFSLIALSKPS